MVDLEAVITGPAVHAFDASPGRAKSLYIAVTNDVSCGRAVIRNLGP